ncbi:AT-rich interactive domain-containing protein 5B [Scomber japonicus]|uniref:AT-rich interactive domain-containing protein 5B n=1 Tax=Scomber japonicus TaxID=13676 RepID=UPI0023058377|nr:AT-rich interactive domain-containing protein 5B [Scomber japonicus]
MEHNAIQWLGATPSCQRGSYAFYKSVSSRRKPDGPVQVWRLGEFYFIRCGPQEPVCIAEVTLLWEDQTQRTPAGPALDFYFLPEDTPKGRTREHGEDEVLAVSRKMVVRVEDLVRWSCLEPVGWSSEPTEPTEPCERNETKEMKETKEDGHGVKVLSYPQYCRFRSLQRRIAERARGLGLQEPHLLALGGVRVKPNIRVVYCRDTFSHPTLENSTSFSWQFRCPSLSLRGRPRKRRGRDGKDSPTSNQSESWIERMKENVMGSVEVGCEGSWLPHPEEQLFLDQLYVFMDRHGSPIHKVPNLGFKKIDLFLMYSVVKRLGGYEKVTSDRLWKVVYNELGGCPGSTSAATCTRRHYERLMLPYEEHLRAGGTELKVPESPLPPKPRGIRGRKPLQRGRKPGPKPKKILIPPPPRTVTIMFLSCVSEQIVTADGTVVVKRGRGRPPGKRNKATLIAQAKLMAQQQAKAKVSATAECTLIPPRGRPGPTPSSTHRVPQPLQTPSLQPVQPAVLPANMPLTPDLSPMSAPFLPFQPKPKDLKDRVECATPGVLLSALPRHFVGGSLGGFSPIKGLCPLDVLRSRVGFQRNLESPALTPQDPTQHHTTIYTLQPKSGSPDTPHPSGDQLQPQPHQPPHLHNRCSGCNVDEAAQRGGGRDARNRLPLPPLRVLPLDLDCSVQVRQLMRTRLDSSQFQTFTRRLSEALSQDLSTKPPCSPITPPPEQALPLNLSKRFTTKRPSTDGPEPNADQPSAKRPRAEPAEDFSPSSRSSCGGSGGGVQEVEMKNQEEPADLSSPSRIRAFLLGLPPFQVKLEEDLTGMRFGKFLPPPGSEAETQRTAKERGDGGVKKEVKKEDDVAEAEQRDTEKLEQKDPTQMESTTIAVEFVKGEDVETGIQDVKEEAKSSAISSVGQMEDFGGQQIGDVEKMECDVEASSKGLPSPVLPQPTALVLAQQS